MQLKIFSFRVSVFSWSWKVDAEKAEQVVSAWLQANPGLAIREIRHDTIAQFWYPPQLLVSIYYDTAAT